MSFLQESQGAINVGSSVTPQQGVRRPDVFGAVGDLAKNLSGRYVDYKESENEKAAMAQENAFNQGYWEEATKIANAHKSGALTQAEATARIQSVFNKGVAQSEGAALEGFIKLHKDFMSMQGFGATLASGTKEEARRLALENTVVTEGLVAPDASQQDIDLAVMKYQKAEAASYNLAKSMEQLNATTALRNSQKATTEAQAAQLKLEQDEVKQQAGKYFTERSIAQIDRVNVAVGKIVSDLAANPNDKEAMEAGLARLNFLLQETNAMAGKDGVRGMIETSRVEALRSTVEETITMGRKVVTGEISKEAYDKVVANRNSYLQWSLTNDPNIASTVAFTQLIPALSDVAMSSILPATKTAIENAANGLRLSGNDLDTITQVNGIVDSNIQAYLNGEGTPDSLQATTTIVNSMLRTVGVPAEMAIEEPEQFDRFIDFFAKPTTGEFLQEGVELDQRSIDKARETLNVVYESEIMPAILDSQRYRVTTTNRGTRAQPQNLYESLEFKIVGNNVVATSEQFKGNDALDRFNREMGPVLSRGVRAFAHLSGSTDYNSALQMMIVPFFQLTEDNLNDGSSDENADGVTP